MDGYLGSIQMFGASFAPENFAFCSGTLLDINNNQALYAILGTHFGGDGRTTVGLPDFRGRTPVGTLPGPGLTERWIGQMWGREYTQLGIQQLPNHSHGVSLRQGSTPTLEITLQASTELGSSATPTPDSYLSATADGRSAGQSLYGSNDSNLVNLGGAGGSIHGLAESLVTTSTGNNDAVGLAQPSLAVSFIICTDGLFPSRN